MRVPAPVPALVPAPVPAPVPALVPGSTRMDGPDGGSKRMDGPEELVERQPPALRINVRDRAASARVACLVR